MGEFCFAFDDPRPIEALMLLNGNTRKWNVTVGSGGVTEIVCYRENGQNACIPWFAIFEGEEITMRVSGERVAIRYQGGTLR